MRSLTAIVTCLFICVFNTISNEIQAQNDSTEFKTEDIVYLKNDRVHRGQIISLDNETGTVVFVDHQGNKYVFTAAEIERIREDQIVQVRKGLFRRKDKVHSHKNSGLDIQVGFSAGILSTTHDFNADEYWLESYAIYDDAPMGARLGLGLQVDSIHYLGAVLDLAFVSSIKSNVSGGLRYVNRYPTTKNAAFYLPLELRFSQVQSEIEYRVSEQDPEFGWLDYTEKNFDFSATALEFSIGQGVLWALAGNRAVSCEVALFRHFNVNHEFEDLEVGQTPPDSEFGAFGGRLALTYHL